MLFKNAGGNKNVRFLIGVWDLLLASSSLAHGDQVAPTSAFCALVLESL